MATPSCPRCMGRTELIERRGRCGPSLFGCIDCDHTFDATA